MAITRTEFEEARDAMVPAAKEALEEGRLYINTGQISHRESMLAHCAVVTEKAQLCQDWHARGS